MNELQEKARFAKDTGNHVMEVIRDDGVNRHIRFREPGTICMHFDLVTWPGVLCYTGDMGTYVFTRLTDMFVFFRSDKGGINPSYWGEKLIASSCSGRHSSDGVTEFDKDAFKAAIYKQLLRWIRDGKREETLTKEDRRDLWRDCTDLMDRADEGKDRAMEAVCNFEWVAQHRTSGKGQLYQFDDFWEHNFSKYTHRFIWCCFAIAWGIQVYDAHKAKLEVVAV